MRAVFDELYICTDDGSYGRKCLVTDPLKEILEARNGVPEKSQTFGGSSNAVVKVWAIGPAIMMKFVTIATKPFNVPTIVSLNTIMIDGTGMCGGCRVLLDEGAEFVCVDGPEFDGHKVDWGSLMSRLSYYRDEEKAAVEHWKEHKCKLDKAI